MGQMGSHCTWIPYELDEEGNMVPREDLAYCPDPDHVHSYTAAVTVPTCTTDGYTTYTCDCGHSYTDNETPATGHDFQAEVTEPTCIADGYTTYTCDCGHSYTDNVTPATGHEYHRAVTAPTCILWGYTTYTCDCGDSYIDNKTPATGHDYKQTVTEPTCTEEGYTTYRCHCGATFTGDRTEPTGHTYEAKVTPSTCTNDGYTTHTCHCGDQYVDNKIPAAGHTYEAVEEKPTCTLNGYTTYYCRNCRNSYTDDETPALGHDYQPTVVPPTVTDMGYTLYTCSRCGDSYKDSYTDKLPNTSVPEGSWDNPEALEMGENTAEITEEHTVHYYTWIAPSEGTLTVTVSGYCGYCYLRAGDWIADISDWYNPGNSVSKAFSKGEQVYLEVYTYNLVDYWEMIYGPVTLTVSFAEAEAAALAEAEAPAPTEAEVPETTEEEALATTEAAAPVPAEVTDGPQVSVSAPAVRIPGSAAKALRFSGGAAVRAMAEEEVQTVTLVTPSLASIYGGDYSSEVTESKTVRLASFSGLVPGGEYLLLALASLNSGDPLSMDNLIHIDQGTASEDGTLNFRYVERREFSVSYVMVSGPSNKHLQEARITFPQVYATGDAQVIRPQVAYNGKTLTEGKDYVLSGKLAFTTAGEYTCYVRGIYDYTGTVECTYRVAGAESLKLIGPEGEDLAGQALWQKLQQDVLAEPELVLTAQAQPQQACQKVTWSSSDETLATVDASGNVRFTGKLGTVTVTAEIQDGSGVTASVTYQILACDHSFGPWQQTLAPTCETEGQETRICTACAAEENRSLPALGHDLVAENETPATCTTPGCQSGAHCSRCDYTEGGGEIPALGHEAVIIEAVAPTCTGEGYTEGKYCDRCGEILVQRSVVPATGHTEKTVEAILPTCTEAGLTEGKYCSVCNETLVKQETVSALGHTEVTDPAKAATCTETGLTEGKHCSVCSETLIPQEVVPALGHDLIAENETPATCTQPGYHSGGYCSRCDYTEGVGEIPALGHSEVVDAGFAATCTEAGLTDGKHCDRCGETLEKQEEIPALGHTEKTVEAVLPTCTEPGLTAGKTCEVCGLILEAQEEVPALGHAFELGACRVCGEKDPTGGALSDSVGWRVEEETGALVLSGSGAAVGSESAPWADFADRITTLVVGPEITEIDSSIFASLPGLKAFAVEESNPSYTGQGATLLSKDGTVLVKQLGTGEESFTVPESIRSIAPKAFAGCDNLQQIRFTGSLPTFAEDCFLGLTVDALYPYDDPSWTAAELGNYGGTVTWMETGRVIADGFCGDDHESVSWELTADGTLTVSGVGEMAYFLDNGPWHDYAEQITRVVIGEGVTHVGDRAFKDCARILSVQLPDSLRSIGFAAFWGCSSLQEITIPENVSLLESLSFADCSSLAKITIPAMVTGMEYGVFNGCTALQEITFLGSAPQFYDTSVFYNVEATVYYPGADTTWTSALRKDYGGDLTWVPQYEQEEVTRIAAPGTELLSGEEMVLSAVLEPGILKDTKILWALEAGSDAVTLEPQGAAAVLTAGQIPEETTVTVTARVEGGTMEPARITLTLKPAIPEAPADHQIFSGKSITLKASDPDTGKALNSKKITWQLVSRNADAYASISKSGKLTAKQVLAKTQVTAAAIWLDSGETLATFAVDILPAVTQLEVRQAGQLVNGKTVPVDYATNTLILTADAYPLDTLKDIQWSISDSKKLAYAEDYIISGNTVTVVNPTGKAGTVTVTATVNAGVKKTVTVKLQFSGFAKEVRIVPPATTTLKGGESLQLTAAVVNSGTVTKPGIVWSIPDKADKTAATITAKGLLKAKKVKQPETITVVAASKDGKASAQVQITIMPEDSFALYLMHDKQYVTGTTQTLNLGDTYQLSVCRNYDGITNGVWSSSKPSVATVSPDGLVTAVGKGTAKITVEKFDEKPVSITVKVTDMVNGMTLTAKDKKSLVVENGETIVQLAASKSVTLTAAVQPTGANKSVTWDLVSGGEYAKISTSGKLTANKDLTAVHYVVARATARDGSGYSETIRVRLHPLAQGVQIYSEQNGITVFSVRSNDNWWNHSNTTLEWDLNQGSKLQLSSHVYPYYGEDSGRNAIQGVTWKSSSPKIATVNEDGLVTCRKSGTVTITATAADGSGKKVSFKLKVVKLVTQLKIADQEVYGGKTLNLAKLITVGPADATNKKLTWEITGGDGAAYATLSKTGTLKTKKVFTPKTVEITVTAQDGSGTQTLLLVTIR